MPQHDVQGQQQDREGAERIWISEKKSTANSRPKKKEHSQHQAKKKKGQSEIGSIVSPASSCFTLYIQIPTLRCMRSVSLQFKSNRICT